MHRDTDRGAADAVIRNLTRHLQLERWFSFCGGVLLPQADVLTWRRFGKVLPARLATDLIMSNILQPVFVFYTFLGLWVAILTGLYAQSKARLAATL